MTIRSTDIVSITDARARLAELADEIMRDGSEKILTKNGAGVVALIDARRLDYYHSLEAMQANFDALLEAKKGLEDIAAGRTLTRQQLRARLATKQS